jgi:hypothetical protein
MADLDMSINCLFLIINKQKTKQMEFYICRTSNSHIRKYLKVKIISFYKLDKIPNEFIFKDKSGNYYWKTIYKGFTTYDEAVKYCLEMNKNLVDQCLKTLNNILEISDSFNPFNKQ